MLDMNHNLLLDLLPNDWSWRWLTRHVTPFFLWRVTLEKWDCGWMKWKEREYSYANGLSWEKRWGWGVMATSQSLGRDRHKHDSQKNAVSSTTPETDVTIKNTSLNISHCLLKCVWGKFCYIFWQSCINYSSYLSNKLSVGAERRILMYMDDQA